MDGLDQFGPLQVEKYEAGLTKTFEFLGRTPHAAAEHDEYDPPVCIYPFYAHVIIYRLDGDEVVIMRICAAREDWTKLV